jgi:uncharacterized protein (TIGR02453 family)
VAERSFFTTQTLAFLRALERHNHRDWFQAHKEDYERVVRGPMIALVERLADALRSFAPDLVASPRTSIYRVYRDTRFSADKTPYKTHIAANFPHRLLPKHQGAGLYLEIATRHVWYGGGMYLPTTSQLQLVREHIAAHHRRLRAIVGAPRFRRTFGEIHGERLQRVPRGFPGDHPAAEWLKFRQFLAGCEQPAEFALSPRFYRTLVEAFRTLAPLVTFLNQPLLGAAPSNTKGRAWTGAEW